MEAIQVGFRGLLRLFLSTTVVVVFFIKSLYIQWRYRHDVVLRRRGYSLNAQHYCAILLKVLNIEVSVKGVPVAGTNFLYVGNHMGFVDIFILASVMPGLFITSYEMRETPVLGSVCEMAGCIFVERRSRTQIMNELRSVKEALEQGFNVVLYPEATSTNGESVLPFKKTLMMAGPHAGRPIQPGCINFTEINGEDFNLHSRDSVCWYGDMSFATALWNTLTCSSMKAELSFLPPIYEPADADRDLVAKKTHAAVSAHFKTARIVSAATESFSASKEV